MPFTLEYIIGEESIPYKRMLASLPKGSFILNRGIVVPTHTDRQPLTFSIHGVVPGLVHAITITPEGSQPSRNTIHFVPTSTDYSFTTYIGAGTNLVQVVNTQEDTGNFWITVVNYAIILKAYAREISERITIPLQTLTNDIDSPLAYRLALPLLVGLTELIPADLETMASLSNKLLVKNLLYRPGTDAATAELLAAFCASYPYFFKMQNWNILDAPLYRSEEVFGGYEAHVWFPNREIERWLTFIKLINNIPQLYSLENVTEDTVQFYKGPLFKQHFFDQESPFANSVLDGAAFASECFRRLFELSLIISGEHEVSFCQASYFLDTLIPALNCEDVDPVMLTDWNKFTLSGRFEQQLDISPRIHRWRWDSPVTGSIDGVNKFFAVSGSPSVPSALKLFIDGILQRLGVDYRFSGGGSRDRSEPTRGSASIRSGVYQLTYALDGPIKYTVATGDPRPFLAPAFSALEVLNSDLQLLITNGSQTTDSLDFLLSAPATTVLESSQELKLHYVTPAIVEDPPFSQYGQLSIPSGATSIQLPFTADNIDYQLLLSIEESPLPAGGVAEASQINIFSRNHSLTGATIEFSAPIPTDNFKLNWWLIGALIPGLILERGTIPLEMGTTAYQYTWFNGPYSDDLVVMCVLWHTSYIGEVGQILTSFTNLGVGGTTFQFSHPLPDDNYRLDYVLFTSQAGNFIEIFKPPQFGQLVEAHYDEHWMHWSHTALTPPADGITTDFILPIAVSVPESLYLTLNGRLLEQPTQYVVVGDRVRLNFAPTANQQLWAVYPTGDVTSEWTQSRMLRLPGQTNSGKFAVGSILIKDKIAPLSTVTMRDVTLVGVDTAEGLVFNATKIAFGNILKWNSFDTVGHTKFSSSVPRTPLSTTGLSPSTMYSGTFNIDGSNHSWSALGSTITTWDSVVASLATALSGWATPTWVSDNNGALLISSNTSGSNSTVIYTAGLNNAFATDWTSSISVGSSVQIKAVGVPANENEFPVNVSRDADAIAMAKCINSHSILSTKYYASYIGDGLTKIKAIGLGGTSYNDTLVTLLNSTINVLQQITGDSPNLDNVFACNVSPTLDASSLSEALSSHPFLGVKYSFFIENSLKIVLSAKTLGPQENTTIISSTNKIVPTNVVGGVLYTETTKFVPKKQIYYGEAPVSSLDGVATRWWNQYGGGAFVFNTTPDVLQEPYVISEAFPVEYHPLDSQVANQPECNYYKGLFTQGLFNSFSQTPVDVLYSATLDSTADGLPRQEKPYGVVDGSNTSFTLSAASCRGQDSLILWLDGIFQPPSTYTYIDHITWAEIETSSAPVNDIWVYYLSKGSPAFTLTATSSNIDTVNNRINLAEHGYPMNTRLTFTSSGLLPSGMSEDTVYFVTGVTEDSFQLSLSDVTPTTIDITSVGSGVITSYLADAGGDQCLGERVNELIGAVDGINQQFFLPTEAPIPPVTNPTVQDARSIIVFLEGLFNLQGTDYNVIPDLSGNLTSIKYAGDLAPQVGQNVYAHYNLGLVSTLRWRQQYLGTGDGINQSFTIPHTLTGELPVTPSAILVFLDGLCQKNGTARLSFAAEVYHPETGQTTTIVDVANSKINYAGHGLSAGDKVVLDSSEMLPSGINPHITYYIANPTATGFQLSLTDPNIDTLWTPVSFTDVGTGVHYLFMREDTTYIVELGPDGLPTGEITFIIPPEYGRRVETAYIRRG